MADLESNTGTAVSAGGGGAWAKYYTGKSEMPANTEMAAADQSPSRASAESSVQPGAPAEEEPILADTSAERDRRGYTPLLGNPLLEKAKSSLVLEEYSEKMSMEQDTYNLLVLRLVEHWSRVESSTFVSWFCLFLATLLYVMNLFLQVTIVLFVNQAAIDLEYPWREDVFMMEHNISVSQAADVLRMCVKEHVKMSATHVHAYLQELCEEQLEVPHVVLYYATIVIWVLLQVKEFKKIRDWTTAIWYTASPNKKRPLPIADNDGQIACLTCCQKFIVFMVVPVVKFGIFLPTTMVGAKFLALQTLPFALVMKAVALQLVLNIDDLLVQTLGLHMVLTKLATTSLVHARQPKHCIPYWYEGTGSLYYMFLVGGTVFFVLKVYFAEIMYFRTSCRLYMSAFPMGPVKRLVQIFEGLEI